MTTFVKRLYLGTSVFGLPPQIRQRLPCLHLVLRAHQTVIRGLYETFQ